MFDTVGTRAAYLGEVGGDTGGEVGGELGGEDDGDDELILGKCICLDFADNLLYTFVCLAGADADAGAGPTGTGGGLGAGDDTSIG